MPGDGINTFDYELRNNISSMQQGINSQREIIFVHFAGIQTVSRLLCLGIYIHNSSKIQVSKHSSAPDNSTKVIIGHRDISVINAA